MSRSKNVRSKYQTHPAHIKRSVAVRDSGDNARTRDSRGSVKNAIRATIESILQDGEQ
jgi:hypothetical protein